MSCLTQGGQSPTEVRQLVHFQFPCASQWETSIQGQTSLFDWSAKGIVSFETINHQRNRILDDYRTFPDRFYGCVQPCHYAKVF